MNETDQRLERIAARARNTVTPLPEAMPFGFATRAIASALADPAADASILWARFSLAALPLATVATAACLWWSASSLTADAHDLAQVFIQAPLFP